MTVNRKAVTEGGHLLKIKQLKKTKKKTVIIFLGCIKDNDSSSTQVRVSVSADIHFLLWMPVDMETLTGQDADSYTCINMFLS
jgi:hypothetical protein